jgi:glutaconate CoA-transferase, subunit B
MVTDFAYTRSELMVAAAARQIRDDEKVFVGMRLPLLGFLLAKSLHAPNAVGIYELGIIRNTVAPEPILTMGDLPNLFQSRWLADTKDTMALLQQGLVDVSFIGGAQVDRFGNLNTTLTGSISNITTRLPGSGGACDLACLAHRHIIIMAHEKRRFVPRVDYITSPGYGDGKGWRESVGLVRGGPVAVITTLGVFEFDAATCEMVLSSVHPGVSTADVRKQTGWELRISDELSETHAPTQQELTLLRQFDPQGYWTGN